MNFKKFMLILMLLSVIVRFPSFLQINWEWDEKNYAVISKTIADGGILYKDIVDVKQPLIYYTYAMFYAPFDSFIPLKILLLIIILLSSLLIYRIGSILFDSKVAEISAFIFILFSGAGRGKDYYTVNTEYFSVFFILVSIFFFIKYNAGNFKPIENNKSSVFSLIISCGSISISIFYNIKGIFILPIIGIFYLIWGNWKKPLQNILKIMISGLFVIIPLVVFILYYYKIGALSDLIFWQSIYAKVYASQFLNISDILFNLYQTSYNLPFIFPLYFAFIYEVVDSIKNRTFKKANYAFIFLLVLFMFFSFVSTFKFTGHYHIFVLPFLCIAAGIYIVKKLTFLNIFSLRDIPKVSKKKIVFLILFIYPSFIGIILNIIFPNMEKDLDNRIKIAYYIQQNTNPSDKIYILESKPEIYIYAKRLAGARFVVSYYHLLDYILYRNGNIKIINPMHLWKLLLSDLKKNKPKVITYSDWFLYRFMDKIEDKKLYLECVNMFLTFLKDNYQFKVNMGGENIYFLNVFGKL